MSYISQLKFKIIQLEKDLKKALKRAEKAEAEKNDISKKLRAFLDAPEGKDNVQDFKEAYYGFRGKRWTET